MRKKIIVVMLMFIILVLVLIFGLDFYKRESLKNDVCKELLDFFNLNRKTKYFDEGQFIWLENAKTYNPNNYDVTDFANWYIDYMYKSIEMKADVTKHYILHGYRQEERKTRMAEILISSFLDFEAEYMTSRITDKDIELYKNGMLKEKLSNDLKKIFNYNNSQWLVLGNEYKKIDIDYGLYLEYKPNKRIDKSKPVKYTCIKILNYDLKNIGKSDGYRVNVKVEYINDKSEKVDNIVKVVILDKQRIILREDDFDDLYFSDREVPHLYIYQHDKDKSDKEYEEYQEKLWEEEQKRDKSKVVVNTEYRTIEKYRKFIKPSTSKIGEVCPEIVVKEMEDGSSKSYFRSYTSDLHNGREFPAHFERELPYKNLSVDEALGLYLNDKNEMKKDEEWLRTGIGATVEYIRETMDYTGIDFGIYIEELKKKQ